MQHPKFISFEGIDGSGKTTQAKRLAKTLQHLGFSVHLLREPGNTPVSEHIRSLLLDRSTYHLTPKTELLLFSASRSQLVDTVIQPLLERGDVVICDRFTDSSIAYQAFGRKLPLDIVQQCNRIATNDLQPILTVYLRIPLEIAQQRMQQTRNTQDRFEASKTEFYQRVIEGDEFLVQTEPDRVFAIDATQPVDQIAAEIWTILQQRLPWLAQHTTSS